MIKRLLSSLIFVSLVQFGALAQEITGIVKDAQTEETLVMASVLGPERRGTVTDVNGHFLLEVPAGEVQIHLICGV